MSIFSSKEKEKLKLEIEVKDRIIVSLLNFISAKKLEIPGKILKVINELYHKKEPKDGSKNRSNKTEKTTKEK